MITLFLLWACSYVAAATPPAELGEETLLMFVGEIEPVVTVASRVPEAATTAPAVVTVISHEQIVRQGYQTIAEILSDQPGFYISSNGRGSVPYLRGLRDSILFLYDGVPLTTDVTKNFAPIDSEISLTAVERIEIVRGPGSVLWGPDAFAGVVNIVPKHGYENVGGELSMQAGNRNHYTANVAQGHSGTYWDAYLAISGARQDYQHLNYARQSSTEQVQTESIDNCEYAEAVATVSYADWLQISGRWSDFTRRYTMRSANEQISWAGEKQAPVNLIKATINKIYGPSHYTLSTYIQETDYRVLDADVERRQRNRVSHVELLWDRRLFGRGLLTLGASQRWNRVAGAVVSDGFLPDFLIPDQPLFVPTIEQEDFSNRLSSAFGQFRYKWNKTQAWVGFRLDDHSQYSETFSYSIGLHHRFSEQWRLKWTFGNAFRSPYSSQLFSNQQFDPESIRTTSVQLEWSNTFGATIELSLFHARLENHRAEDVYGGLSESASQESYGSELTATFPLHHDLTLRGGISLLGSGNAKEHFKVIQYTYLRPDGSKVVVYDQWDEDADQGPKWQARLGFNYQLAPKHNLSITANYGGKISYSYEKGTITGNYRHPFLVDLTYRCPGFIFANETLSLHINNLLDQDYQQPDVYGATSGEGIKLFFTWQLNY